MSHHGIQGQPEGANVGNAEQGYDASRKHIRLYNVYLRKYDGSPPVGACQFQSASILEEGLSPKCPTNTSWSGPV